MCIDRCWDSGYNCTAKGSSRCALCNKKAAAKNTISAIKQGKTGLSPFLGPLKSRYCTPADAPVYPELLCGESIGVQRFIYASIKNTSTR